MKAKARNEFRHHLARARVELNMARGAIRLGMFDLAKSFVARAASQRAAAHAWRVSK